MTSSSSNRTERLTVRLTPAAKRVLQAAAAADHRSVNQFVIDSSLVRAEEVLPARRNFDIQAEK